MKGMSKVDIIFDRLTEIEKKLEKVEKIIKTLHSNKVTRR